MSDLRKLPYNLRHSDSYNETTSSRLPELVVFDLFPNDSDERIDLILNVSLNEFVRISSAIDVGRDIAYGEDSLSIWDAWVSALKESILDCEEVANCIDTSDSVQGSITGYLDDSGSINPDKSNSTSTIETRLPSYSNEPVAPPVPSCDMDKLWAGIREMVVRIDDGGRDVLEDLTLLNDKAEQVQGLIDLVPLLGDIIADLGNFFTQVVPDLLNGYNSFSSETEIDALACELFNLVCSECRYPTFEEVMGVYSAKSIAGLQAPQLMNYTQVWNAVKDVPALNGNIVYHTVNTWQLVTLFFNSKFGRYRGVNTLNLWASVGEDVPSNSWQLLCGDCVAEWCYRWDYQNMLDNWTLEYGVADGANGFKTSVQNFGYETNQVTLVMQNVFDNVTSIEFTGLRTGFKTQNTVDLYRVYANPIGSDGVTHRYDGESSVSEGISSMFSFSGTPSEFKVQVSTGSDSSPPMDTGGYDAWIETVTLRGTGVNPFGENNC